MIELARCCPILLLVVMFIGRVIGNGVTPYGPCREKGRRQKIRTWAVAITLYMCVCKARQQLAREIQHETQARPSYISGMIPQRPGLGQGGKKIYRDGLRISSTYKNRRHEDFDRSDQYP